MKNNVINLLRSLIIPVLFSLLIFNCGDKDTTDPAASQDDGDSIGTVNYNANLSSITPDAGSLNETFVSWNPDYTMHTTATAISFTAQPADTAAMVAYYDSSNNPLTFPYSLSYGPHLIKIVVTAPDGISTSIYTVTVNSLYVFADDYRIYSEDGSITYELDMGALNPDDPDGGGAYWWEGGEMFAGGGFSTTAGEFSEGTTGIYFTFGVYGAYGWSGMNIQFGCDNPLLGYGGWNQNGPAVGEAQERYMGWCHDGWLSFDIKTTNECQVSMEGPAGNDVAFLLSGDLGVALDGNFTNVQIPISNFIAGGLNIDRLVYPFKLYVSDTMATGGTIFLDDIKIIH